MVKSSEGKKRKAPQKEVAVEPELDSSDDEEFTADMIDGTLAQEDSEGSEMEDGDESEAEEFVELGDGDEENGKLERRLNGVNSRVGAMSISKTNGKSMPDEEDSEDDEEDEDYDEEEEEDDDEEEEEDESETEYEVDEDLEDGVRIVKDSQGNPRYLYPEIDPRYDSDDTDVEESNTIGNIPLEFYEQYPHIGYDINGKRIMRPATGEALDHLLESIDLPKGWTGQIDKNTGKMINLTKDELEMLRKITKNEVAADGYDPYPEMIEYFTSKTEIMPLSAAPEPKRRFVPSKHEAKRVMKIVRAIREGRIVPQKPKVEEPEFFDLWADNAPPKPDHIMNIPAPKLPPPQHDESYNPPQEYLLTAQEKKEWEEMDPEDRRRDYMPQSYSALRLVPGYDKNIKERFERCLDLYLAPRVRRKKLNIDPESLLPKLPSPQDLRPFPTSCATLYKGHEGRVRTLDIDPSGSWLATGGDDGTVRVWEILTGRQLWKMTLEDGKEAINSVRWRPGTDAIVLAAAVGDEIHLLVPPIFDPELESAGREVLAAGWGYAKTNESTNAEKKENAASWTKPSRTLEDSGLAVVIALKHTVKHLAWHRRGDYLATVSPEGQNRAVTIHQISKHHSQHPFRKSKGIIQRVEFHPFKPILFVATQRYIRVYDLAKQDLIKTLQTGAKWISSFDVHPGGDNVLVGTYDKRLLWHDLDLSLTPYKTMRYHDKAIRSVAYHHGGLPLFCSSSDDGTIQVFHGRVVTDLLENALIVPLKILRGHKVKESLGVLDTVWHPKQPWLFSAGADGTARMWF